MRKVRAEKKGTCSEIGVANIRVAGENPHNVVQDLPNLHAGGELFPERIMEEVRTSEEQKTEAPRKRATSEASRNEGVLWR